MKRLLLLAVPSSWLGCLEAPPPLDDNAFPVAHLVAPQIVQVGDAVLFDARGSDDEDGDALEFVYGFGDGAPEAVSADDVFEHVFGAPGTYTVTLTVRDERAYQSSASLAVVVVEGDVEGCSCALPCFDEAVCTQRGCFLQASSDDDDVAFDDEVVCD